MANNITQGRKEICKSGLAGLNTIFIADYKLKTTIDSDGKITDIQSPNGGAAILAKYEIKGKSGFTQDTIDNKEAGLKSFEQKLNLLFTHVTSRNNREVKKMSKKIKQFVILDNLGNAFLMGLNNGVTLDSGNIGMGQKKGEFFGYNLTFSGTEATPANFIYGSTIDDPFGEIITTPCIIVDDECGELIDPADVFCFIASFNAVYNGVTLAQGDGFISDNHFYSVLPDLLVDACNEGDFELDTLTGQLRWID